MRVEAAMARIESSNTTLIIITKDTSNVSPGQRNKKYLKDVVQSAKKEEILSLYLEYAS